MDFDTAKENIQPLRHGRRADRLELALGNEKEILDQERKYVLKIFPRKILLNKLNQFVESMRS
jgi:hypothetical protein